MFRICTDASQTRVARSLFATLATLLLSAGLTHAQDAAAPEVVRTWSVSGGAPIRIATADGRVFLLSRSSRTNLVVLEALATPDVSELAGVAVPRRPTDLALDRSSTFDAETALHVVEEHLYVTTTRNDAEIVVVSIPPGQPPVLERTIDLPGNADALGIVVANGLLYVGRRLSAVSAELLVLETSGVIVGSLDLPQSIEDLEVSAGTGRASSRRLTFTIDVADPTHPIPTETAVRSPREPPLPVAKTMDFAADGPMAYLAVKQRGLEVQQVNVRQPLGFPDVDGDGAWRLGCLGDSNTAPGTSLTRWCEKLAELIDDPRFTVVNFAVVGATAIPSDIPAATQVASALDPALRLDAVVLAFGTNDTNLVHFAPDPALFDQQIADIADSIEGHVGALEAAGRTVYVATAPPRFKSLFGPDGFNERIVALNEQIRARFPAAAVIEHYDYIYADTSEIADGVHLNQRGQGKRAWRAFQALTR